MSRDMNPAHRQLWAALGAMTLIATTSAQGATAPPNEPLLRALSHAMAFDNQAGLRRLLTARNMRRLEPADRIVLLAELIDRRNLAGLTAAVRAGLDPNQPLRFDREGEPVTYTPLNYAIGAHTGPEVALRLIDLGADVNLASVDDNPPLLTAAGLHRYQVITRLLARGADPNAAEPMAGLTPLMAVVGRKTHHAEALAAARDLVEHGANIDAVSLVGYTPLMFAASCGNTQAVQWLQQLGADTSRVAGDGESLLSLTAKQPSADDIAPSERMEALDQALENIRRPKAHP